jgi:hypothetical protein
MSLMIFLPERSLKMNRKQVSVLAVTVILFSLSELFPPWLYEDGLNSAERSAGFHFILGADPQVKSYPEMKRLFSIPDNDPEHGFTVRRDVARLLGQRILIPFVAIAVLLAFDYRKSTVRKILAGASACVGVISLGLYFLYVSRYF